MIIKLSYKIFFSLILLTNGVLFAQPDSSEKVNKNSLNFSPAFHNIQIDASVFFILLEYGGHIDFDLFQNNNNVCLGSRFGVEHYSKGDFGGAAAGSPYTNYNLYLRFSKISKYLSFNFLGGISYYTTDQPDYLPNKVLPRIGFEIKYGRIVGIILKGATSFNENNSFIGIGLSLDYCHIL